jgi:ER-bound oxygenase mpaB/B'/Rubber oxygenase, catalytic domain
MTSSVSALKDRIAQQKDLLPQMYGAIDFGQRPERFTVDLAVDSAIRPELSSHRARLLADEEQVALIEAFTMLGDIVADAYAALIPQVGFRQLVDMLERACDDGIASVENAPPELVAFIEDMERTPDWLDMDLVEEGARLERNATAHVNAFLLRGGLIATFMNTYAALPMAITGAFSERTAGKRAKETGSFFTGSVLPGSLRRHGWGFKAAAKVRLMHSMVRFNILSRGKWDPTVYGVPIPQVDQMPAGMIGMFLMSQQVLRSGRRHFTAEERARVEFARYRCFLLGLPEELLRDTPQGIVDTMATRHATLRKAYDDATCGELVRDTMAAYLEPDTSLKSRLRDTFGRSLAKVFFVRSFLAGDTDRAAEMGVAVTTTDKLRAVALALLIKVQISTYEVLMKIPATRAAADARLVEKVASELRRYGDAEFTTDSGTYRHAG